MAPSDFPLPPGDRPDDAAGLPARVTHAGPGAFYLDPGPDDDAAPDVDPAERAARLEAWRRALRANAPAAVRDVLAGARSLLVEVRPGSDPAPLRAWLERTLERDPPPLETREHRIEVRYGEGLDDDARRELERATGLPFETIAERHAGAAYTVAFLGFTAGFPYLLGTPEALRVARREHPEGRIPAGAMAIAGGWSGIYPAESPGGWWPLGRTDAELFVPHRDPPALLAPGDRIRLARAGATGNASENESEDEPGNEASASDGGEEAPNVAARGDGPLQVRRAWPRSLSVQAGARWGWGHLGVAQAGALDPLALQQANAALGLAADAPGLELLGNPATLIARSPLEAALAGGGFEARLAGAPLPFRRAFRWPEGAELELVPSRRGYCSYLALAGGVRAELWGGSASSDVRAGAGGSGGFLEPGDRLAPGELRGGPRAPRDERVRWPERLALPLWPGPQHEPDAFATLVGSSFRVAGLDRTGCRLAGPRVELGHHEIASEGSPWGAVQVPPSGRPVVLLADRGRTGGYAKPAVVDPRALWRLAQARPGTRVWFYDARAHRPSAGTPHAHRG